MHGDVESKLRDLGRAWNETIPHVDVGEIVGDGASERDVHWEVTDREPVSPGPSRWGWSVSAAAVLVVVMVGSLAWFVGAQDADPIAPSSPFETSPELVESSLVPGIPVAEAAVVDRGSTVDRASFEIDKGSFDGIEVGMAVVDASGLVGKIATVNDATSIVLRITSEDYAVEATVSAGQPDAIEWPFIARGDGESMLISAGGVANVRIGDPVETSGSGQSLAPPGVPIGVVSDVSDETSQLVIDPHSASDTPSSVRVLLFRPLTDAAVPVAPSERLLDDAAPSGAMVLDQFPAVLADATGYFFVGTPEASQAAGPVDGWIQRWYTATMDRPELQPRLKLASTSATQQFPPQIPPAGVDAVEVSVKGESAWLFDDPQGDGRSVTFREQDTVFLLTGYQLSDEELLTAAANTTLADTDTDTDTDSAGAVIDPEALPAGLVERAVGIASEESFVPLESAQHPPASIRWFNTEPDGELPGDDDPMLWLSWRLEDPDLFPLHRLDYDTVTDTTIHGLPAFSATNNTPGGYLGVLWSENGYTYTLGGFGLDQDTVLLAADQLRQATNTDWAALEPEPA